MARHRNGQCRGCGCWLSFGEKGTKCRPCKSPPVRAARKTLNAERKANRETVILKSEAL